MRAIGLIAAGSAAGHAITFLATALLTRLYTPAQFGTFSVILAILMATTTVSVGRFDLAIPLPQSRSEARNLLFLGTLAAGISITLGIIVVGTNAMGLLDQVPPTVRPWIWTLPVLLIPVACYQLLSAWALRESRFKAIAGRNVSMSLVTAAAQIAAGLIGMGVGGLIAGYFAGQFIGSLTLAFGTRWAQDSTEPKTSLSKTLRTYRRFPLILAPTGFANTLGAQAPLLIVATQFGAHDAGMFALAQRVLSVPSVLIGQATSQVFASQLAKLRREGSSDCQLLFNRISLYLLFAATPLVVILMILSPLIFSTIFGTSWHEAGRIAQGLSLGVGAQLIGSTVSQTLVVFDRLALIAAWDFMRLICVCAAIIATATITGDLLVTAWVFSGVTSCLYAAYWVMSWRTVRHQTTEMRDGF